MDGRDIGYVVLPNANVKIFLTASVEERAKRRFLENQLAGKKETYEEILENIISRDFKDSNRDLNPLRQADDAVVVDNSHMTREEQMQHIIHLFRERCATV